jgi:hypothetical protein
MYEKHCTDGVMINQPAELQAAIKENCASENSKLLEEFIEDRIIFTEDQDAVYERSKLHSDLVQYIADSGIIWNTKFAMNDLKKVLEDRHIKQIKIKLKNRTAYVYSGIKPAIEYNSKVSLVTGGS